MNARRPLERLFIAWMLITCLGVQPLMAEVTCSAPQTDYIQVVVPKGRSNLRVDWVAWQGAYPDKTWNCDFDELTWSWATDEYTIEVLDSSLNLIGAIDGTSSPLLVAATGCEQYADHLPSTEVRTQLFNVSALTQDEDAVVWVLGQTCSANGTLVSRTPDSGCFGAGWEGPLSPFELAIEAYPIAECAVAAKSTSRTSSEVVDPYISFDINNLAMGEAERKVLISKFRQDDHAPGESGHFSSFQIPDSDPTQQNRPKFKVTGSLVGPLEDIAGKRVYLKIEDPPDTAPYVTNPHNGDNRDTDNPPTLTGVNQPVTTQIDPGGVLTLETDCSGRFEAILETTRQYAGDNYRIVGSLEPDVTAENCLAHTGVITAWKRVYVEVNKMFKKGAFINMRPDPNLGAMPGVGPAGSSSIPVTDITPFLSFMVVPPQPFTIRLIGGRSLVDSSRNQFATQDVVIKEVVDNHDGTAVLVPDLDIPGNAVRDNYYGPEGVGKVVRPFLADAVGVLSSTRGETYYLPAGDRVNDLFDQAFVDYVWLTDAPPGDTLELKGTAKRVPKDSEIPSFKRLRFFEQQLLARKWSRETSIVYGTETGCFPPQPLLPCVNIATTSTANHQILLVMNLSEPGLEMQKLSGVTAVTEGWNRTFLYVQTALDQITSHPQLDKDRYLSWVTAHELAHQWSVDRSTPSVSRLPLFDDDTHGHCGGGDWTSAHRREAQEAWDRSDLYCLMTHDVLSSNDVQRKKTPFDAHLTFHNKVRTTVGTTVTETEDSEFAQIRESADPIPQN